MLIMARLTTILTVASMAVLMMVMLTATGTVVLAIG